MHGPDFREYHASADGAGRGLSPFYGWTLLAHFLPRKTSADKTLNRM